MGVPAEQVFKTIVVTRSGRGKPLLIVIPGDQEVNLKKVAAFINEKKVYLPTEREAERLTGLKAGGISPLALINRGFEILIDQAASSYDYIYISGGQRGLNIRISPGDVLELTGAKLAAVTVG
jgi:Cys-tRNA(Pro)/Cys-tRNA(Cys) deacylase